MLSWGLGLSGDESNFTFDVWEQAFNNYCGQFSQPQVISVATSKSSHNFISSGLWKKWRRSDLFFLRRSQLIFSLLRKRAIFSSKKCDKHRMLEPSGCRCQLFPDKGAGSVGLLRSSSHDIVLSSDLWEALNLKQQGWLERWPLHLIYENARESS